MYEVPQRTPEVLTFETWIELQDYLGDIAAVVYRIETVTPLLPS